MPLSAHATGKDAEVLDEAVNLIVGPRADATHRQAINSGHDLGAESIGINVIPLRTFATLTIRMATLAEVEGMAHFSAFIQISIRAILRTWRMMRKQKNPAGVALGRLGGLRDGPARAKMLTAAE